MLRLIMLLLCALMLSSCSEKRGSTRSELPQPPSCESKFKQLCEPPVEPVGTTNAQIEAEDNENAARWAACIVRHAGLVACTAELERLLRVLQQPGKSE